MTIGAMMTSIGEPPSDKFAGKLHTAFKSLFSDITVEKTGRANHRRFLLIR
jgi:hypothetical protein